MSRHDAQRSGVSKQALADDLYLEWVREYPPLKTAWADQPKMLFDRAYDPVVMGSTMFVGSSRHDTLAALDTRTGSEKWAFHADGPIRFAPVAWDGKVYFVSDDGHLYCLDAGSGKQLWKFRGGPGDRKILGNQRLISTWPARGGPVLADGVIYFAASIWPFMGIFIHAVDARTGAVVWTNDGDGSIYIKQPHNAEAFGGVAPQGALVVAGDKLLVPGGRSVPACLDRKTGKLLYYRLAENGKRGGGSEVSAALLPPTEQGPAGIWFNGGAAFELNTGEYLGVAGRLLALGDDVVGYASGKLSAFNPAKAELAIVEDVDRKGVKITKAKWKITDQRTTKGPAAECLIQSGQRLYVGSPGRVEAIDLPLENAKDPHVSWEARIEGTPANLLSADDRLFVVTLEGRIYCFGARKVAPRYLRWTPSTPPSTDSWTVKARAILDATSVRDGYCVAWGIGSGRLITELARQSNLHLIAIDGDAAKVDAFRKEMIAAGLYGERVSVHAGDPLTFPLPPYLASLMVVEDGRVALESGFLKKAYAGLRPYGGVACFDLPAGQHKELGKRVAEANLESARVRENGELMLLSRDGALHASGDWTHEHADATNTRVSPDRLVKLPLGILWFGGSSHQGILPRHGHGPQPQVIDGRVIVEGVDMMRAMDIYTGRVLWETSLPGVGKTYNNLAHQPGANATGANFISMSDGIYVVHQKNCVRLDPTNGAKMAKFQLPQSAPWTYINVAGDVLVGGYNPPPEEAKDRLPLPERLQTWDFADRKVAASLDGHVDDVLVIAFSPDGKLLATSSDDKTVRLWDAATNKLLATFDQHTEPPTCLAFSADGAFLASGGKDRNIHLFDTKANALKATLKGHKEPIACLMFSADGKSLTSADLEANVRLWDIPTEQGQGLYDGNIEDVTALTFTPDGKSLVAGTAEGTIKVVDLATREVKAIEGHKGLVAVIACSADGKRLVAGNKDRSIKLYDLAAGKLTTSLKESIGVITSVSFTADGSMVAAGSEDANVHIWDLATGKIDRVLKGSAGPVKSFAFTPDGKAVITAAADKVAKPNPGYQSSTKHLVVMDRHSGKVSWTLSAQESFRNNAVCIGGGRLYCIDRTSPDDLARLKRRGLTPANKSRLLAIDLHTGKEVWSTDADVFGTWLSYSAKHDVLVEAGRKARDTLLDEPRGMQAFRGDTGKVLWKNGNHLGLAMIRGDDILHESGACELLTGKPRMRIDPVSGQAVEWKWARTYGCNTPLAAEHLMTFRSGAAGYCDLVNDAGTGNFGGFRSSCTNNLIVAGGVLTAPDYTRTCTCSYQNQTSLALVHMPEVELWTRFPRGSSSSLATTLLSAIKPPDPDAWHKDPKPIKHLALNLGAPGSRRATAAEPDAGRLWLHEYEHARVQFNRFGYYNSHSSKIVSAGPSLPWVIASGCRGITRLDIALKPIDAKAGDRYTIRLHFTDPDNDKPGVRLFDVAIQDQPALTAFDIVKEAGARHRAVIKEFKGISAADRLTITFTAPEGADTPATVPVLAGVEMVREE